MSIAGSVGLVSSLVGSFASGTTQKKIAKSTNKALTDSWADAAQATRDQLTVAYNRTLTSLEEVNRDKIYTQIAAKSAGIAAKGTAEVNAAQLGIEGKRGVSFQTREIDREVANVVSDSEINAQVQVINTTNAFTDAAKAAVNNLNNQSPVGVSVPSTLTMVTDVLGSGVNYYNKLSTAQRSDLKQNMKIAQSKIESILKF